MVCAVLLLSVLHEYVIPDFEVLAAFASRLAIRAACRTSCIEEHFRIRSTRTCLTCWSPPVVLTWHEVDMGWVDSKFLPSGSRFLITRNSIITLEYRNGESVDRNSQNFCKELEAEADHLVLEVITEGPVSEHLEECEMMRIADTVDIAGTDAFLVIAEPLPCRVLLSEDIWYKRMHTRCSEKNRRIVFRYKGCS